MEGGQITLRHLEKFQRMSIRAMTSRRQPMGMIAEVSPAIPVLHRSARSAGQIPPGKFLKRLSHESAFFLRE